MNFIKDSVIYVIGEVVSKVFPFILLPFLTRNLTVNEFADYSYLYSIYILASLILMLSQDGSLSRYYFYYGPRLQPIMLVSGVIISTLILMLLGTLALNFSGFGVFTAILAAFTSTFFYVQIRMRQCRKKAISYVKLVLVNSVFTFAMTILVFKCNYGNELTFFICVTISNMLISFIACWNYFGSYKKIKFTPSKLLISYKYLIAFGGPTLIHQLAHYSKGQLDRLVIYRYYPKDFLAEYFAGFQISLAFVVIISAINKAIVPYYYESLRSKILNKYDVLRFTRYSFFCIVPLLIFLVEMIPSSLFTILLGDKYAKSSYYAKLFTYGAIITIPYLILVGYLFFNGKNLIISKFTILSAFIYMAAFLILININIAYAPYAMIISNLLLVFVLYMYVADFE